MKANLKSLFALMVSALVLLPGADATARSLDDFDDNVKTGWTDFTFISGFGVPVEAEGQFKFVLPAAGQSLFSASTKTSQTYTLQDGRTLEFRVDLVSGNGPDAFAILAYIPTTSLVSSLSGYAFAKSTTDILITKGIEKYFYNENVDNIKNENVTLVLSLTGQGASVLIHAQVLDKDNNAVLWERTVVDTPDADVLADGTDDPAKPYTGPGNLALLCYEDGGTSQATFEVTFDNAEVFVLDNAVLDDFDDNVKTAWSDFTFIPGFGLPVETDGQFQFNLPPAGQSIFTASTKTSRTFALADGERLVFSVDMVSGNGKDSFALVGYFPSAAAVSTLTGYGLAKSATDILITKGINKYFYNEDVSDLNIKNENVILSLSLEGRGTSVVINGRILDKDNDNAVLWERTVVDTEDADVLSDGTDDPAKPFFGAGGFCALLCYEDDGKSQPAYGVIFDNLRVAAPPVAANTPPIIGDLQPAPFANFVEAAGGLSFTVTDDKPLVDAGITVTLNGQVFGAANGLVLTGPTTNRQVFLGVPGTTPPPTVALSEHVNYTAVLQVVDADKATNTTVLYFDTFAPYDFVIEAEDYNFSGGQFINDPVPVPAGAFQDDGYRGQTGWQGVDYSDTLSFFPNAPYRGADGVGMQRSLDNERLKYLDWGGPDQGYYDYDVGDIRTGEWLNYTRDFPEGNYEVYLRESLANWPQSECVLERVLSSPDQTDQVTEATGSFLASPTGFRYRNFPLTDASGQQKIVLHLAGVETFRLRQVTADPPDGAIFQNYLIFIPTAGSGVQRPLISSLAPAPGAVVQTLSPAISIAIRNRDTALDPASIVLEFNGQKVSLDIVSDDTGASITYSITPLPPAGVLQSARLVFKDSDGVYQTNNWSFTFSYKSLDPRNRRTGEGSAPGFLLRMVQAPPGSDLENNLARAEAQLAPHSTYPAVMDTNTIVPYIKLNQNYTAPPTLPVPGLYDENGQSLGNGTDDFAVELLAYLDLAAGVHRFAVRTDDGYKITSGAALHDLNAPVLAAHNGGPANETFDFVVTEPGLYPIRMVWYERGGDAVAELYSVDLETGDQTLINDPEAENAVKAYTEAPAPLFLESAAVVTGPFAEEPAAVIDPAAHTITVPYAGGSRFFRLRSSDATKRLGPVQITGATVTLGYQE
jgi:hypothetical protein